MPIAESLLYVRHTSILLYGRLEVVGEVDHKPVRLLAEYHTAGLDLVKTVIRHFLSLSYGTIELDKSFVDKNDAILESLGDRSFKFLNALRLESSYWAMYSNPGSRNVCFTFSAARLRQPPFLR